MLALYTEPDSITAGDTLSWKRSFPKYPASAGWMLNYAFQNSGSQITFQAATDIDGQSFDVNVPASVTAGWKPGSYFWTAYLTGDTATPGQRKTVRRGSMSILPNPAGAMAESHARRMLRLVMLALEDRIPRGLESTTIDGQELHRIPLEQLYALKQKYEAEVYIEKQQLAAAIGVGGRRNIGVRFKKCGLPFGSPGVITTGQGE